MASQGLSTDKQLECREIGEFARHDDTAHRPGRPSFLLHRGRAVTEPTCASLFVVFVNLEALERAAANLRQEF